MKDLFKDPDLWRQKRGELPVDSEAQSGWQEMQSILDKHLPVLPLTSAPHVSKAAKIIKAVKAIKATSVLIASLTVATVAGTAIYLVKTRQHKNISHHQPKKHGNVIGNDSLDTNITIDSLNQNTNVDSLKALTPSTNKTDSTDNAAGARPAKSSNVKSGGLPSKNQQAIINGQIGNGNNTLTSSTAPPNHNIGNYVTRGTHHGKGRQMSAGNLSTHQGTGLGTNATSANALPDIFKQNDNAKNNNDLIPSVNTNRVALLFGTNNDSVIQPQISGNQPVSKFVIGNSYYNKQDLAGKSKNTANKNKTAKSSSISKGKTKSYKPSSGRPLSAILADVDWGVLIGANSSGSFTPGAQNSNIYGSFPVDIYPGVFGTYHLNNKLAINVQARFLTPLNLSGSYDNKNYSGVDSAQFVKVTDSRKAYFVSIPIHMMYKINDNISIKGGPVINIPVKQINANTTLQRLDMNLDTIYFANTQNKIKTTRYDQKINLGLSGGISVQYNRLIFEALYQKSLSGYQVKSDFGNYKSSPGSLQISVGFKLNSSKHH